MNLLLLVVILLVSLSGCGSGSEPELRTECRNNGFGQQVCTTYRSKEDQ